MYTTKDLYKRLQAGEAKDNLADEMSNELNRLAEEYAKMLNTAVADYEEEERTKAKAKEADRLKTEGANEIAEDIDIFIHEFYPQLELKKGPIVTGKDIIDICDIAVSAVDKLMPIFDMLEGLPKGKKATVKIADNEINDFLRAMGLK